MLTAHRLPLAAFAGALLLALPGTAAAQASLTAEQVQKLRAATVYVKVTRGLGGGVGSGFVVRVDGETAYIVTNAHVLDPTKGETPLPTLVQVVFDSGTPKERSAPGIILASDPLRDLAVLKVNSVKDPPTPIDVTDPPKLLETMPVFVCGFPFGDDYTKQKNPEISIGPASVSSIRTDGAGRVLKVQLNGALNPGNSGGPAVTADGKLVGVVVSKVPTDRGTGVGFAIPQHEVEAMLRGRPGAMALVPANAEHTLEVRLIDPLKAITEAVAYVRPKDDDPPKPEAVVMTGATKVPLTIAAGVAMATVPNPAPGTRALWVQIELTSAAGKALTIPAEVRVATPGGPAAGPGPSPRSTFGSGPSLPPPSDFLPKSGEMSVSDLNRDPEKHLGKEVEFDALTSCGLKPRDPAFELELLTAGGKEPSNLRVVVTKDLGLQLADLGVTPDETYAVRVKGTVGKPSGRGETRHTLDVAEIAFLGSDGKPAAAFKPETDPRTSEPTLGLVNRFPDKFKGKAFTFTALFKGVGFAGQGYEVHVANENDAKPLNLEFYTSKDMATQAEDDLPRGTYLAKLEGAVEKVSARTGKGWVGVTKVTLLNPRSGQPLKTLTADQKIVYPTETPPPPPRTAGTSPAPRATATPAAAENESTPATRWVVIGAVVGGLALVLVAGGVAGLLWLTVFRGKAKPATRGRDDDEDDDEPRKPARPARSDRGSAKPAPGAAPDEFPGFG